MFEDFTIKVETVVDLGNGVRPAVFLPHFAKEMFGLLPTDPKEE